MNKNIEVILRKSLFFKKNTKQNADLIIHIGEGKTGSSAIQSFLNDNSKKLLENGIFYPPHEVDENKVSSGHGSIYDPLLEGDFDLAKKNLKVLIEESRSKNATLLISSENFQTFSEFFKYFCNDNSIRISVICFVRDMVGRLNSAYNQGIKRNSYSQTLQELILSGEMAENLENRGDLVLAWMKNFKKDLILVPYTPAEIEKGVENIFLQAIGVEGIEKITKKIINRSYTASALLFKRELNKFVPDIFGSSVTSIEIDTALQAFSNHYKDDSKFDAFSEMAQEDISILEEKIGNLELNFLEKIQGILLFPAQFSQKIETKKSSKSPRKYSFEFIANSFIYEKYPNLHKELKYYIHEVNHKQIDTNFYTLELAKAFGCDLSELRMAPLLNFDIEHHKNVYPGIENDGVNPYEHFIVFGLKEGKYNFDL